jgi:hypothetical protein
MAGLKLHPALKALVAVPILALGLTRPHAAGIALIGAALLCWAALDGLSRVRRAGDASDDA